MHLSSILSLGLVSAAAVSAATTTTTKATTTTTTTTTTKSITTSTTRTACPYSSCIKSSDIPSQYRTEATSFCSYVLRSSLKPVTSTVTATTTITSNIVPALSTSTVTSVTVATSTSSVSCTATSTTVTAAAPTFINYPTGANFNSRRKARAVDEDAHQAIERELDERQLNTPNFVVSQCKGNIPAAEKLKSACSCLVTPSTTTTTTTSTSTVLTTQVALTTTTTVVSTSTTIVTSCTLTVTPTVTMAAAGCGTSAGPVPTASTQGSVTCSNTIPTPSSNARQRIEGNDSEGTIYEGCIVSGPRDVTTPSGGTHRCDGTNGGANPAPGTAITAQTDAAARMFGFTYDGTYSDRYQDFFIQRIGATAQTSDQFWGVLQNEAFTPAGGCQSLVAQTDRSLWAFDAFNVNGFLTLGPDFAAAEAGKGSVTVTISSSNGFGTLSPFAGATIAGQTSNSRGTVTIPVPSLPGCYQYKATAGGQIRSNALYLSVYSAFAAPAAA